MESMEQQHRTLEINLQSAKDLNKVNLITKMDVFAVVSISGDTTTNQKFKTPVDPINDANPTWNFPIKFTLNEQALQHNLLTLDFNLVCQRAFGDRDVGDVHVPIKELLDSPASNFVSYQVRKPSGRPKGQLTFSYKFFDVVSPYAAVTPPPAAGKVETEAVIAYPAGPSVYPPPPQMGIYPPVSVGGHYPPVVATGLYPEVGSAPPQGHHEYVYPPPQQQGYGYPPAPPPHGYSYPPPLPPHGYPAAHQRHNRFGENYRCY